MCGRDTVMNTARRSCSNGTVKQLKALIPPLLEKWQEAVGVEVAAWGIKRMRTKWGSCNFVTRRIWLNLELQHQ